MRACVPLHHARPVPSSLERGPGEHCAPARAGRAEFGTLGCCARKSLTALSTGMAHRWSEGHYLDLLLWGLVVFLMLLLLSKKYMFLMFQMSMVWGQLADLAPPALPAGPTGPRPVLACALWPAPCFRRLAPRSGPHTSLARALLEQKTLRCDLPLAGKARPSSGARRAVPAAPPTRGGVSVNR